MENEDCEGGGNQGLLSDRILDLDLDEDQDLDLVPYVLLLPL